MQIRSADPADPAPDTFRPLSRLAMRALAEFMTHVCSAALRAFDGDLDIGLVFVALLRQGDFDGNGGTPISINALSRSLARPFETVRRLCNRLCEMGLAERTACGICVPHAVLQLSVAAAVRTEIHDNFVRLVADLTRLDYPMPASSDRAIDSPAIERNALDLVLFCFEFGVPPHPKRDWQRPFFYIALMAANARPFTFDPLLARRYADITTPPPDAHRMPVTASALSRALGMPVATMRRNLEALVAAGQVMRAPAGGYLINMAWMQNPVSAASGIRMVVQLDRVLRQAVAAGFPFHDPASAYRRGPPLFLELLGQE